MEIACLHLPVTWLKRDRNWNVESANGRKPAIEQACHACGLPRIEYNAFMQSPMVDEVAGDPCAASSPCLVRYFPAGPSQRAVTFELLTRFYFHLPLLAGDRVYEQELGRLDLGTVCATPTRTLCARIISPVEGQRLARPSNRGEWSWRPGL